MLFWGTSCRFNPRKTWYSNLVGVTAKGDYEVTFRWPPAGHRSTPVTSRRATCARIRSAPAHSNSSCLYPDGPIAVEIGAAMAEAGSSVQDYEEGARTNDRRFRLESQYRQVIKIRKRRSGPMLGPLTVEPHHSSPSLRVTGFGATLSPDRVSRPESLGQRLSLARWVHRRYGPRW
jgi:hypothetical protein